eukprot:2461548-Prymnesium_polylepis.1
MYFRCSALASAYLESTFTDVEALLCASPRSVLQQPWLEKVGVQHHRPQDALVRGTDVRTRTDGRAVRNLRDTEGVKGEPASTYFRRFRATSLHVTSFSSLYNTSVDFSVYSLLTASAEASG